MIYLCRLLCFLCDITGKKEGIRYFEQKMTSLSVTIRFSFLVPCWAINSHNSETRNETLAVHCIFINYQNTVHCIITSCTLYCYLLYFVFLPCNEIVKSKVGHFSYSSNRFYEKVMEALIFKSWPITIIHNEETVVRSLQRYFTIKFFMLIEQWGLSVFYLIALYNENLMAVTEILSRTANLRWWFMVNVKICKKNHKKVTYLLES